MLTALPLGQGVMALVWLAVIVLLILAVARGVRLLPAGILPAGLRAASGHLSQTASEVLVSGSTALDQRRRIYLVEAAGQRTLVLTGGPNDVMLALPPVAP